MTNARLNSRFGTLFVLIALFAGTVMTRFNPEARQTGSPSTEPKTRTVSATADVENVAMGVDVDPRHLSYVQTIA
jgi:hypothetical protein